MARSEGKRLETLRQKLEALRDKRVLQDQTAYVQDRRMVLAHDQQRLGDVMRGELSRHRQRLTALSAGLDAMSPLKVLGRGYSIAQKGDGGVISSVRSVQSGERFSLRLSDGSLKCIVEETEREGY